MRGASASCGNKRKRETSRRKQCHRPHHAPRHREAPKITDRAIKVNRRAFRRIGYVPGDLVLYPKMTGRALVDWFADLRGRPGSPAVVDDLVDRFAIELDRPVAELSKGNRQKIGLLQAFAHEPDLVILDEPTSGLDPLMQDQFQRLVRETCGAGRTVFLSSHSLDEVQHVADRVGIIRDGRLIAVEVVEALRERALRRVEIHGAVRLDPAAFTAIPGVRDPQVSADGTHLTFTAAGHLDAVVKAAAAFEVVDFVSQPADLDEIFLTYYRGGADPADANLRGGS